MVASTEPLVLVDGDGGSAISRRTFERQSLPIEARVSTIVWSNQSMRAPAEMRGVCIAAQLKRALRTLNLPSSPDRW